MAKQHSTRHPRGEGIAEEGELFRTHIGGSAVVEGVMMRGRLNWAVAVRQEDGGMYVEEHDLPDPTRAAAWRKVPIVRGCIAFVESMRLSMRAMAIAADHAYGPGDATGPDGGESADADAASVGLSVHEFVVSSALGIVAGIGLFVALPVFLSNLVAGELTPRNVLAWNLVEALVRIALLIAYVWVCGRFPDMARVFGYHGAEHQTIHCFEHGEELTPAACARYSRLHVRCGTAFLVMTVCVAILVNPLVPVAALADAWGIQGFARNLFVFASRLVLLPLVAGISYEVTVKWAGAHPDNPLVRLVLWPGLQMQRLTTNVPDPGMLECAIAALQRVDARERQAAEAEADGTAAQAEGAVPRA